MSPNKMTLLNYSTIYILIALAWETLLWSMVGGNRNNLLVYFSSLD